MIESGLIFGRSHHPHSPDTAPPILDLSGDWTIATEEIKERRPMNIMQTIESELELLRNLNISFENLHFLFFETDFTYLFDSFLTFFLYSFEFFSEPLYC